jgi:hypothetical protein
LMDSHVVSIYNHDPADEKEVRFQSPREAA